MKLLFFPFFVSMNILDAKAFFNDECALLYDTHEAEEICSRVIEHLTSKSKLEIKLDKRLEIDEISFKEIVSQLKSNKPLQYILGYEWFFNLKIIVNEHVLIPRPETEELVRWILDILKKENRTESSIIDIGTGSGCIPVVIKNEMPHSKVTAIDISTLALEVAKQNAKKYHVEIEFIEGNILENSLELPASYDIIVSNPPYITSDEKIEMHTRVLNYEPHEALFVTNRDPLQFYKAILFVAKKYLTPNGLVFLELNSAYGIQTELLFKEHNFETELKKDMYGNVRMLCAKRCVVS